MTDPIPARRYDFAIRNDQGEVKPAAILLPADLTWEEVHAVIGAVTQISGQVAAEAAKPKLTLVRQPLPPESWASPRKPAG